MLSDMDTTFETVTRPDPLMDRRRRKRSALTLAVIETGSTGKAIRVPRGQQSSNYFHASMGATLQRDGFHLRTRIDGDFILLWAVKKEV